MSLAETAEIYIIYWLDPLAVPGYVKEIKMNIILRDLNSRIRSMSNNKIPSK